MDIIWWQGMNLRLDWIIYLQGGKMMSHSFGAMDYWTIHFSHQKTKHTTTKNKWAIYIAQGPLIQSEQRESQGQKVLHHTSRCSLELCSRLRILRRSYNPSKIHSSGHARQRRSQPLWTVSWLMRESVSGWSAANEGRWSEIRGPCIQNFDLSMILSRIKVARV